MPYVFVENFALGMDRRAKRVNGKPGSLWDLINCHLTRAGEIERRKKFVSTYALPADGTKGLHAVGSALYVFGAGTDPGVPSGVTYQRLQHPDGSTALSQVLFTESYDGKIYAIGKFADGAIFHYYDGVIVNDWVAGVVRAAMTNNDGIAEHLKTLIDASANYGATRSGSVVTVTGSANVAYDVETETENVTGGTDNQTLVAATTQAAIEDVAEVLATGSFSITAGSANTAATGTVTLTGGASGSVDSVTVNGVTITSGAVPFNASLNQTAADLAANITAHTSSPEYTAAAVGAVVTITAAVAAGADPNGFVVAANTTTITTSTANMGSGVTNAVTSITVDGVDILGARVNWAVSSAGLATNIATQINNYTSSPNYSATANGVAVTIRAAAGSGANPNGLIVAVNKVGSVTTSTPANMSGGVAAVTGQPQIVTLTVGGTFNAGDKFNVTLDDESFGFVGNPEGKGVTLLTFKSKIYSTVGSILNFCGVNAPTVWNRDNVASPGANFINLASQDEGSQTLTALQVYQGNLAAFARNVVQIWSMDADEDLNTFLQPLKNTGTRSPRSALSYGNNDVFYLSDSGIRSIRARDSSNAAFVSDVGTPIDTFVQAYLKTLTDARIEAAWAILEPLDDRYWLFVGARAFVFSYFPASKISAWSYYDLTDDVGGDVAAAARVNDKLYVRSGDTIFLYGGAAGTTYPDDDEIDATAALPFLDANSPGTKKNLDGFDAALTGAWDVKILVDPTDEAAFITVGTIGETTYPDGRMGIDHSTTHFAPVFTCSKAGAATISNLCVHYDGEGEKG